MADDTSKSHPSQPHTQSTTVLTNQPSTASLTASSSLAHLSPSLSSAKLATSIQANHHDAITSGLASLTPRSLMAKSPRRPPVQHPSHVNLALEEKTSSMISEPKAQLIQAFAASPPKQLQTIHGSNKIEVHKKGTYHHLPPMTEAEKTILFDALPTLRQMDDVPAHSLELRSASLSIIRQWLQDKLSTSKWVSLIQNIKIMAEGSEHTNINAKQQILQSMGMDARTLHSTGIPRPLVHRIYKALWVYSLGMHELITEVSHHAKNNHIVIGNIWKCYAILLEDYQGEDYVMALLQVEAESQRVLKLMEERFGKSLQLKQENEVKTQTEVKTLSTLLERSQLEARTLLEKKEALLQEIHHLETLNTDMEAMNSEVKKELWFTSNTLNRVTGKYDQLVKSSKLMEEKLLQDIHELKLEQEEVKASLDQELATNERLSYKVDRFTSNIADLTANTTRLKTELNEKTQEVNLANKVLEKTTLELSNTEREKGEQEVEFRAQLAGANEKIKELEEKIHVLEESERLRIQHELAERDRAELLERAKKHVEAGDPIASSPLVLDLQAQMATLKLAHAKELSELNNRNAIMTDRIRALQKKVRDLGGGNRFKRSTNDDSEDELEESESVKEPLSPRRQLKHVTDHLRGLSKHSKQQQRRRATDDDDDSSGSTNSSKSNSRRNSRTRGRSLSSSSPTPDKPGYQYPGTVKSLAIEVSQLEKELESKEKLNTNLLVNINKLKVNLNQQTEESRKKDELAQNLKSDLSTLRQQLATEQQTRITLHQKEAELQREIDRLLKQEKLVHEQAKIIQELQKHKIQYLTENTDLSAQILERTKELKNMKQEFKTSKTTISKLKDEVKDLQTECDQRSKNQNELGLRIRTLNMENQSLQSLNDEIQRNMKSTADNSSLLGSLETKNNEINRLFLKIRDMEHARIELIKQQDIKLAETKQKAEAEAQKKADEALTVEHARTKKLRSQITDQKNEYVHTIDTLRKESQKQTEEVEQLQRKNEKIVKENERLMKVVEETNRKLEVLLAAEKKLTDKQAMAALVSATTAIIEPGASPSSPMIKSTNPPLGAASPLAPPKTPPTHINPSSTSNISPAPLPPPVIPTSNDSSADSTSAAAPHSETPPILVPDLSLLSPGLIELGVDELTSLLTGVIPVNTHTLAAALKDVSVKLAESSQTIRTNKETKEQLEESNFMFRNQIRVLEEQIDSLKSKYRDVVGRLANDTDQSPNATGGRKRKNKKSMSVANTGLVPDESSSSDDEDGRKGGVRFNTANAKNFANATKRGSTNASKPVEGGGGGPPSLVRSQSISKLKVKDDKDDSGGSRRVTLNRSPRATMTRNSSSIIAPVGTSPNPKQRGSMEGSPLAVDRSIESTYSPSMPTSLVFDDDTVESIESRASQKLKSPSSNARRQLMNSSSVNSLSGQLDSPGTDRRRDSLTTSNDANKRGGGNKTPRRSKLSETESPLKAKESTGIQRRPSLLYATNTNNANTELKVDVSNSTELPSSNPVGSSISNVTLSHMNISPTTSTPLQPSSLASSPLQTISSTSPYSSTIEADLSLGRRGSNEGSPDFSDQPISPTNPSTTSPPIASSPASSPKNSELPTNKVARFPTQTRGRERERSRSHQESELPSPGVTVSESVSSRRPDRREQRGSKLLPNPPNQQSAEPKVTNLTMPANVTTYVSGSQTARTMKSPPSAVLVSPSPPIVSLASTSSMTSTLPVGGLLSPSAAMAALQQLRYKVETSQKAVNFPKL